MLSEGLVGENAAVHTGSYIRNCLWFFPEGGNDLEACLRRGPLCPKAKMRQFTGSYVR